MFKYTLLAIFVLFFSSCADDITYEGIITGIPYTTGDDSSRINHNEKYLVPVDSSGDGVSDVIVYVPIDFPRDSIRLGRTAVCIEEYVGFKKFITASASELISVR
jgi:hypothetical protein